MSTFSQLIYIAIASAHLYLLTPSTISMAVCGTPFIKATVTTRDPVSCEVTPSCTCRAQERKVERRLCRTQSRRKEEFFCRTQSGRRKKVLSDTGQRTLKFLRDWGGGVLLDVQIQRPETPAHSSRHHDIIAKLEYISGQVL